jgi:hypothetical protein
MIFADPSFLPHLCAGASTCFALGLLRPWSGQGWRFCALVVLALFWEFLQAAAAGGGLHAPLTATLASADGRETLCDITYTVAGGVLVLLRQNPPMTKVKKTKRYE